MIKNMNVLLTNDDGIQAEGLKALYGQFKKKHQVMVVAPDREQSGAGHAISLHRPLRVNRVGAKNGFGGYAVNGMPADCVKLAILELCDDKPDLVVAGINPGANLGMNINYSGTVAAAREAALYGLPAIAVAADSLTPAYYEDIAKFTVQLADKIGQSGLPAGTLLNVNFPDCPLAKTAGIRVSPQGTFLFGESFEKRTDPRQKTYYWHGRGAKAENNHSENDATSLAANYIAITPIKCDTTDYETMASLTRWNFEA